MHIGIGIHVDTAVLPKVYFNHMSVVSSWSKTFDLSVIVTERIKVAAARNKITRSAWERGCTHILFLDSDHLITEDLLPKLTENSDKAMVSGLVCRRNFPFTPVVFKKDSSGSLKEAIVNPDTGVMKTDAVAMGCTLLNLDKASKLSKPVWKDDHFRSDINICERFSTELNESVYVDTRVCIGHLGENVIVTPQNADKLRLNYLEDQNEAKNFINVR